jgi:hypothetical protein
MNSKAASSSHRPILESYVFTRSMEKNKEKPHRRLQQGDDVHRRRRRGPNGQGLPLGTLSSPSSQHAARRPPHRPHGRGHRPAPEPLARPPTTGLPPSRTAVPASQLSALQNWRKRRSTTTKNAGQTSQPPQHATDENQTKITPRSASNSSPGCQRPQI